MKLRNDKMQNQPAKIKEQQFIKYNEENNIIHNIVKCNSLRKVQKNTLSVLKNALSCSFGPLGSNTIITKDNALPKYTKDGHTILDNIVFGDIIEKTVCKNILDITNRIVLDVGDGTTSAVILSSLIFNSLCDSDIVYENTTPHEIISKFKDATEKIKQKILLHKINFSPELAYHIAYTSTNSNDFVADQISEIYRKYGNDVYITVSSSVDANNYIKSYDGVTLNNGYTDPAYINDKEKGVASLSNPQIYAFSNAVDTKEMVAYFMEIVNHNILNPYQNQENPIPTVIMMPSLSKDAETFMAQIVQFMYGMAGQGSFVPLLILTDMTDNDVYHDVYHLCGCKPIKKYIDPKIYEMDVEKGLAPTKETICDFYGTAEVVEANASKTKFINPKNMYEPGTSEYSDDFNSLITFLESELKLAYENQEGIVTIAELKKRINSLKANMVDLLIGGISLIDRDSLIDLTDDAIKNCRSAAQNGVGYGANFEGLRASYELLQEEPDDEIVKVIFNAYKQLSEVLYSTKYNSDIALAMVEKSLATGTPYDLHSGSPSNINDITSNSRKVLTSINTDIVILDAISKIITMMYTANQLLTPNYVNNKYMYAD